MFVCDLTRTAADSVQAEPPVQWTFSEVGGLKTDNFVTPSLIKVSSFDGLEVPAWFYQPRVCHLFPDGVLLFLNIFLIGRVLVLSR